MKVTLDITITCLGAIGFFAIGLFFLTSLIKGHGVRGAADYLAEKAELHARKCEGAGGALSQLIWFHRALSVFVVVFVFVDTWRRGLVRSNMPAAIMFLLLSVGLIVWVWFFPHRVMKREAINARSMAFMVRHVPWIVPFLAFVTLLFGASLFITCVQDVFGGR